MMKIEQCIEDFMNSIVKRDAELFCSLLCPNSFLAFVNECIRIKI